MDSSDTEYRLSENNGQDSNSGNDKTPNSLSSALQSENSDDGIVYDNPIAREGGAKVKLPSIQIKTSRTALNRTNSTRRQSVKRRRRSSISSTNVNNEACVLATISVLTIVALVTFFISVPPEVPKKVLIWLESNRGYGIPILMMTLCIAIPTFLPVSKIVYIALGYLYGFWTGWFAAMVGVLLGFILTFLLGRFVCARWMKDYVDMRCNQYFSRKMWIAIRQMLEQEGAYATFVVRFLPLPSNLVSYALSQTNLQLKHYVLGSLMKAPIASTPVYIWLGTTVEGGIDGVVNGDFETMWISLGFSALFLVFFFIGLYFLKKHFNQKFMKRVRSMSRKISLDDELNIT